MSRPLKILLVEDSAVDAEIIQRLLKKASFECTVELAMSKKEYQRALDVFQPDIILSDNSLPQFNAIEALATLRARTSEVPFILVTGTVSDEFAASIIKSGADDYILKDRLTRLPTAMEASLKKRKAEKEKLDAEQKLRQSEERYRALFQNSPLPIFVFNLETLMILDINEAAIQHYGYTREEFFNLNAAALRPEEDIKRFLSERAIKGKAYKETGIWRHLKKDGSIIIVQVFSHDFLYNDIPARIVLAEDITDRKKLEEQQAKAEQQLLESEARLKQAQEIAHVGSWEINFETNVSQWSDEAYRIYGLVPGKHQLSFEEWMSFIHPDDLEYVKQEIERSQVLLTDTSFYHRIIRKDGIVRHVYSESKFEFDKEGKPVGMYGIVHDVTERRKAEEEIIRSNERYDIVTRATSDVIWDWDLVTGKVYRSSEGLKKVYGYSDNALIENIGDWNMQIHPDDRDRIKRLSGEIINSTDKEVFSTEYRFLRQDGTYTYVLDRGFILRDKTGRAIRMIGAAQDITERKEKEEQLRQLAGHLQDIREEERASMAREIHDELGQQLTGLKIDISWLAKKLGEDDHSLKEKTSDIIKRLDETIKTVRKIATELRPSLLDDVGLVEALEWQSQEFQKRSGINTRFQSNLQDVNIPDNVGIALFRIYQESLTNVARHSEATQVKSSLQQKAGYMVLIISDNGKGFDMTQIAAKKTLGLLGMKERVLMIGGVYEINSKPDQGTIVSVKVPLPVR